MPGFEAAHRHPHARACARRGTSSSSPTSATTSTQFAALRRGHLSRERQARPHRRACATTTSARTRSRSSTASSARQQRDVARLAARLDRRRRLRAAPHRQLQGHRERPAQRPGLAGLPPGRDQRPAERSALHARRPRDLRRPARTGTTRRRGTTRSAPSRGSWAAAASFNVALFDMDIERPAGHRHRGLVLVARHLQRAQGAQPRRRGRVRGARRTTTSTSRSRAASTTPRCESLPDPPAAPSSSGIEEGNRLPTVPEFQVAAAATYQWPMSGRRSAT